METTAATDPKITTLLPAVALKPVPVMVTVSPAFALNGVKPLMVGACAKAVAIDSRVHTALKREILSPGNNAFM